VDAPGLLLYDSQVSGNCYKVRLVLAKLGLAYERVEVDVVERSGRRELLGGKNPALRVPVLRLEDGRHLAESNAIIWYLAEGTPLVPRDPFARASVLQWLFFEQYSHEPNIAVVRFWVSILGEPERFATAIEERRRGGDAALDAMEEHLRERSFLVADACTVADIALYAYTHVAGEGGFDLGSRPAVRDWLERVAAQPGHVPMSA
jgi:glutathione S-transferase